MKLVLLLLPILIGVVKSQMSTPLPQAPSTEVPAPTPSSVTATSAAPVNPVRPNRGFVAVRDTIFRLFTRRSGMRGEIIKIGDTTAIRQSTFNASYPTRFIIHDWMNEGLSAPTITIRDAYLEIGEYNVFIVDWDAGSIGRYLQVRNSAPSVGRVLAQFIEFMMDEGQLNIDEVHLIGYGLGAHIAGVTGKSLTKGRLPVIYALDPIYLRLRDTPNYSTVLTHADADYVEVIHTSILTSRLMRPIGHANFYVNYGWHQPGCILNPTPCSHERAYKYFAESIKSQKGFYGTPCSDYREMTFGLCRRSAGPLVRMGGESAQKNRWGIYLVRVNPMPPYAIGLID